MAELIRVLHSLPIEEAQRVVDAIAERRISLVWEGEAVKRVLDPDIRLGDQILILVATLADAFGVYSDPLVGAFIEDVKDSHPLV